MSAPAALGRPSWRRRLRMVWRGRLRASWRAWRWVLVAALALVAATLGAVGHRQAGGGGASVDYWLYLSLQLFTLEGGEVEAAPWSLSVARLLAPAVAGYAAWQALSSIFRQQVANVRLRFLSNHVVVAGLGEKGRQLAFSLVESGYRVVGVERDEQPELERQARDAGLLVLTGDARDEAVLRRARVHRATYVLALCGDDGTNADVVGQVAALASPGGRSSLTAFVHMVNPDLAQLLRAVVASHRDAVRLEFFNVYDSGARALLQAFPPLAASDGVSPHVVVVGFDELGQSVARHAAVQLAAAPGGEGRTATITVLDPDAGARVAALRQRCPQLAHRGGLRAQTLTGGSPVPGPQDLAAIGAAGPVTAAYVCVGDDAAALTTGLTLVRSLPTEVPVVVVLRASARLGALVQDAASPALQRLHCFALLERTCVSELVLGGLHEVLARAFHSGYLSEVANGADGGAPTAQPWERLPEPLRESNRQAAAHIRRALAAAGYELAPLTEVDAQVRAFGPADVETMAEMEHERWCRERLGQGWVRGPKDAARKTNPNLVPWAQLPPQAKEYDRQWVRSLPDHLLKVGLQIEKVP